MGAASCVRPIVTTNVPDCREIVHGRDNDLLMEYRNVTALADVLAKLFYEPGLWQRMGQREYERVLREFSQEKLLLKF